MIYEMIISLGVAICVTGMYYGFIGLAFAESNQLRLMAVFLSLFSVMGFCIFTIVLSRL